MEPWSRSALLGRDRFALVDRDVPNSFKSLEHLLRYCARPAFALERLSSSRGRNGGPERIRYTLPRHKRGQWAGPASVLLGTDGFWQGIDLPGEQLVTVIISWLPCAGD